MSSDQELTRKLDQLRAISREILLECDALEFTKTDGAIQVQVNSKTGEPVEDQDGYYFACSMDSLPDTMGDSLRVYVPVGVWKPESEDE